MKCGSVVIALDYEGYERGNWKACVWAVKNDDDSEVLF